MDTAAGFSDFLRGFRLCLTVEGLALSTVGNYCRDTSRFGDFLGNCHPSSVTPDDVKAFLADFQTTHSAKTTREAQLAIRRFFRFLYGEELVGADPTRGLKLPRCRVEPQPTYSEGEVKRLLLVCRGKSLDSIRNQALVLTLFDTGVREGELISMGIPDWERARVRVSGKTGTRYVPLGMATLQAIERYVRRWKITDAPLWRGKKGPLTGSGVFQLVKRLCRRADVPEKGVHAFRRAAAAQMKRLGMNDSDILEVCGWRSIEMLRRYTAAVSEELAQNAHKRYSPGDALTG